MLVLVALLWCDLCVAGASPSAFTSDGCSLFPDDFGSRSWCGCCVAHDLAYWRGGTQDERRQADRALRHCVAQTSGSQALAQLMFLGVRLGGSPHLPTEFRWGFGWPQGRGYRPIDDSEQQRLDRALRQTDPAQQLLLICRE